MINNKGTIKYIELVDSVYASKLEEKNDTVSI